MFAERGFAGSASHQGVDGTGAAEIDTGNYTTTTIYKLGEAAPPPKASPRMLITTHGKKNPLYIPCKC